MTAAPELGQLQLLDLTKVEIHESNPRKDVGDLTELAASIKSAGVLEPIVVVKRNGHFAAVTGSRRTAASRLAGMTQIPARVMELDEAQVAAAALIENLQRKDLAPLEEAEAFQKYLQLTGCTQKELADRVGKAPSTIANALRLLEAPKLVKDALAAGTITAAHARVALSVPAEYASRLPLKKGVTVGDFEDQADDIKKYAAFVETVKAAVAKARAQIEGEEVLTWSSEEIWAGRERTTLEKILGKAPAPISGSIEADIRLANYREVKARPALHDEVCKCRAFGLVTQRYSDDKVKVERVCISAPGYKKYVAGLQDKKTRDAAKSKVTPAQQAKAKREREAAVRKREKAAVDAAERAIAGRSRYLGPDRKPDPKFMKGGLDREPARLALFAIATSRTSEWAPGWRAEVWRRIAKMPIKEVRTRAAEWVAIAALSEINSRQDEKRQLQELIFGHFKVELPAEPKKKAKR